MKDNETFPAEWFPGSGGVFSVPMMLRPRGRMSFSPGVDWNAYGVTSDPAVALANAQGDTQNVEHPNFTGSNVRLIDGEKYYFDPINGPWDVDNDGDGVTDSVWIDVGMPEVTFDGTRCQPLVAMMIVDLDSRANVNVHGSRADFQFGASPRMAMPRPDTGVFYAGTDPDQTDARAAANAKSGLGWGPADVELRHIFNPSGSSEATATLAAGEDVLTASFLHGSEATGTGAAAGGITIPSIKTEGRYGDSVARDGLLSPASGRLGVSDPPIGTSLVPTDNHLPNHFGAAGERPIGSPIDPYGITKIVLDQMGQPYFSRPGSPASWQNDTIDDPYDLSVGGNAPKPGWLYDPAVDTAPSSVQDNLFSPTQLERLLRLYENNTDTLTPRLVSLLGSKAPAARQTVTSESWDTTAVCVPLDLLNPLLDLSDQSDDARPSLISWDLQMGVRMDVNRPFGDGLDNDGNGVADEPGESGEPTFGELTASLNATRLCNGRAANDESRSLFARHLYCLVRYLCPDVPAKEAAQWAVNVVDYRDTDSIMTRFEYDPSPGLDGTSPTWNPDPDHVVWGCERPEMLISEAMAWNNVREEQAGGGWTYTDSKEGGLVIELYHPWTSRTDENKFANPAPAEFTPSGDEGDRYTASASLDLGKKNSSGEPVFQIVVVEDTEPNRSNLADDAAWPNETGNVASVAAVIYPADVSDPPPQKNAAGEWHTGWGHADEEQKKALFNVQPGQFAVVTSSKRGDKFADPQLDADGIFLSPIGHDNGITGVRLDLNDPDGGDIGFSDSEPAQPIQLYGGHVVEAIQHDEFSDSARKTSLAYPKDSETGGPIGAVVAALGKPDTAAMGIPITIDGAGKPQPKKFRILLRRLANPLLPFDRDTNPYLTADSLVVQQQVCVTNTAQVFAPAALGATQRVENLGTYAANNAWKQAESQYGSLAYPGISFGGVPSTVQWTLGFFPRTLKIPTKGDRNTPPFPWLTWLDREYANVHELLLVPKSSSYTLLQEHSHEWPFPYLFFGGGTTEDPVEPRERLGLLEFLRTVSRFADSEYIIPPADAAAITQALASAGGKPLFLPPHNRLTTFREPGRVNLNTLSSKAVWNALNGGRPPVPYEDEVHYDDLGNELDFVASEDWQLQPLDEESPPEVANWALESDEDTNDNNRLDFNHDADNNGFQAKSRDGILRSVATSRRGWPLVADTSIAGQFDRILNRRGVEGSTTWFSNAFQSGWVTASAGDYDDNESLLLRQRKSSTTFVRLTKPGSGYGRLSQGDISLQAGRQYTATITVNGDFTLGVGDNIPEFWKGATTFQADTSTTATSGGKTVITATFTPTEAGTYSFKVALFSRGTLDVESVSLVDAAGGGQLLKNRRFADLTGDQPEFWSADGGSIAAMGEIPTNPDDPADDVFPTLLLSPNLYLRGPKPIEETPAPIRRGFRYNDPQRNPYFAYQNIMGLSNVTTPRSNVFAVWMTIGFFEIEEHPVNSGQQALGVEYGLETGENTRHKAFMIIDRSIPVGFQPGQSLTEEATILLNTFSK